MRVSTFRQCGSSIASLLFLSTIGLFAVVGASARQVDIHGPEGSGRFGYQVVALPNGNIVVNDPYYDIPGGATDVGAVYLYNGATGAMISMLTGSTAGDGDGSYGLSEVTALTNGNFVVSSPFWDNAGIVNAGAVTFVNGTTGLTGTISAANSLVGSSYEDRVGIVTVLTNGNYIVRSPSWRYGEFRDDAGAVTFGNGTTGITGVISASNSLISTQSNRQVGSQVVVLTNNNYVVANPYWNGPNWNEWEFGAVTFCNGTTGTTGIISAANSLVGSRRYDRVGAEYTGITALANGNYVVRSPSWDNGTIVDAGAVTWCDGTTGVIGTVSTVNSLVGSTTNDRIGRYGVTGLVNGNYVVRSPDFDVRGAIQGGGDTRNIQNAGAISFGNGTSGTTGTVSASNSLVGSTANDEVGSYPIVPLTNGNYVALDWGWNGVGAVTFGDGTSGTTGEISASNSLVGSTLGDSVGWRVTALANGNYVVGSQYWDNGAIQDAGAATFCDGKNGTTGPVSASNSLVGSHADDHVGSEITALTNGNYVVASGFWDSAANQRLGAATFGNGTSGVTGTVSMSNSLVGMSGYISELTNGNYVVKSPSWDNGLLVDVGAVTLGNGTSGTTGIVSASNSLVGSTAQDYVGLGDGLTALPNGNYVVGSPYWDNGSIVNAGAISYLSGTAIGDDHTITANNSVLSKVANGAMVFSFDAANNQLVVGRPMENIVTLFSRFVPVSVSGRVMSANGAGIRNAIVSLTDASGSTRTARTGSFGYYRFANVTSDQIWVIEVTAKGYSFTPRTVSVMGELTDIDFVEKQTP